jgi:threonylcarbamoyladenosine tRNA methylthiotransferase MtaB
MPQLAPELVKARAARLREAAAERRTIWLDGLVGTTHRILVENQGKGYAGNMAPVVISGTKRGDVLEVRVTGREGDQLVGVAA